MRRFLPLLLGALACTRTPPTGPAKDAPNTLSATIDGVVWTPTSVGAVAQGTSFTIIATSGIDTPDQILLSLRLQRNHAGSQGMLPGTNPGPPSAQMTFGVVPFRNYSTVADGGNGIATITTLTATRATGTFEFIAPATSNGPGPAQRRVVDGKFDVALPPG